MKRLSVVLYSALLLTLLIPVPVAAKAPVTEKDHVVLPDTPLLDCTEYGYAYTIYHAEWFDIRSTTYFDQAGEPIRFSAHLRGVDTLYNPSNPDYTIAGNFSLNYVEDLLTGENRATGLAWHITVPGYGAVVFVSGQEIYGPDGPVPLFGHHELDPVICEVLAFPAAKQAKAASAELNNFLFRPAIIR